MANFNRVILLGNLTRDPQLKYLPNKTAVCEVGLAVNREWGKGSDKKKETTFVDCVAYSQLAEAINQHMQKGRPMLVDGRLKYESWQTKQGEKRNKLRVMIDSAQFLGKPKGDRPAQSTAPDDVPVYDATDDIPW